MYDRHIGIFDWKGRAMDTAKDMYKVYSKTSTVDLIRNRNKKIRQLQGMSQYNTYWAKKDKKRLQHMIDQIEAVIEMRKLQQPLF